MRLTDYDKLQLKLRAYADKKAANGEIELANGILKAKCFIDQECEIINEKQINGGWIPVNKEMPNKDGFYIVSMSTGKKEVECVYFQKNINMFISNGQVIAWQPLPEPYKEVE